MQTNPSNTINPHQEDMIAIGKVGRSYGYKGWFHVTLFPHMDIDIMDCLPWHIPQPNHSSLNIHLTKQLNHKKMIAKCDTVDDAKSLLHAKITIATAQLPPLQKNTYYDHQLIGLQVYQGDYLWGQVESIMHQSAHKYLVIEKENQPPILIPYLEQEVILSVDLVKQIIWVQWHLETS